MSHRFVADSSPDGPFGAGFEVRHVQPYQAVKTYRCPGCDHEIRPGEGHEVVVPHDAPQDRRHWHSSCWQRAARPKGAKQAAKAAARSAKRARRKR